MRLMSDYFCTRCGADLGFQKGFDPRKSVWTCKVCDMTLVDPDDEDFDGLADGRFEGVVWYCDRCGRVLNKQEGFKYNTGEYVCKICGQNNRIDESEIFEDSNKAAIDRYDDTLGMSAEDLARLSYYRDIWSTDMYSEYGDIAIELEKAGVWLVADEAGRLYVRKRVITHDMSVFEYVKEHPLKNMPKVVEILQGKNCSVVIEEYIPGSNPKAGMGKEKVFEIFFKLLDAVEELHGLTNPVVHRDIKPENILLSEDDKVYLVDLGAAKWENAADNGSLGPEGRDTVLMGTANYAAPEQYGFGRSTVRTDIYALGEVLCYLLTGRHSKEVVIEDAWGAVIRKCTKMDPEDRFDNVAQLRDALAELTERISDSERGVENG